MLRRTLGTILAALPLGACAPDRPPEAPPVAQIVAPSARPRPPPPPPPPAIPAASATGWLPPEPCGASEEGFDEWLQTVRRAAWAHGVSPGTVRLALESVTYDGSVIALDREQAPLKLTFTSFVAKRVTPKRVARGKQVMAEHGEVLGRITSRFHVAPEVLVAIWGLETDYGANAGTTPSMQALATLAYDCRRAPRFRDELVHALRIVERGDLTADELYGAWAGELGQTQFLPSSYDELGVDFDGDGRVDMVRSAADALASTAHFLEAAGWRPGERYEPGTPNFIALRKWNASEMYCKTIVLFASKLVGP